MFEDQMGRNQNNKRNMKKNSSRVRQPEIRGNKGAKKVDKHQNRFA